MASHISVDTLVGGVGLLDPHQRHAAEVLAPQIVQILERACAAALRLEHEPFG